jgi:hypothetical protein
MLGSVARTLALPTSLLSLLLAAASAGPAGGTAGPPGADPVAAAIAPSAAAGAPATALPPVPVARDHAAGSAVGFAFDTVGYRWPLDGQVTVVRGFDPPTLRWLPGHRGVDLAAALDSLVRAAGSGVVRFAGPVVDRGVISIDHPGGLRTTYEPVLPTVVAGDRVAAGDPIGVLAPGHRGCPADACLHWGLRQGELYLDPLALLGLGRARLLPVSPRVPADGRRRLRLQDPGYATRRLRRLVSDEDLDPLHQVVGEPAPVPRLGQRLAATGRVGGAGRDRVPAGPGVPLIPPASPRPR